MMMMKKQNCVIWIQTYYIYKDIAEDIKTRLDSSKLLIRTQFHWKAVTQRGK